MKKVSALGKLQKKCDTLMQIKNKKRHKKCEACGGPNQVAHHWIEKSRSSNLRYNEDNLIPLCQSCHSKIHNVFGNNIMGGLNIAEIIIKKRGKKWKERMEREGRITIKVNKAHYEKILSEYEQIT